MKLDLYLYDFCPFCQRIQITAQSNGLEHNIHWLDSADTPDWFYKISPLGTVPVIQVDDSQTIFESAVINEFLDQVGNNDMLPQDPVKRAISRAWIEYASSCQVAFSGMLGAADKDAFKKARKAFVAKLQTVEDAMQAGIIAPQPEHLSLLDTSFAPLFVRMQLLGQTVKILEPAALPKVQQWMQWILENQAVKATISENFPDIFKKFANHRGPGGYIAKKLA